MHDFPHIRYLYLVNEVFQQGRISIAADIVHLSQPAATQALARVEKLLGVQPALVSVQVLKCAEGMR